MTAPALALSAAGTRQGRQLVLAAQRLELARGHEATLRRAVAQRLEEERAWEEAVLRLTTRLYGKLDVTAAVIHAQAEWHQVRLARWWRPLRKAYDGLPVDPGEIRRRLAAALNERAWAAGAVQLYLGLALPTSEAAGQSALEYLGLNTTFAWAHPQAMAQDLFAVRGSKVVQGLYGQHLDALSRIIALATDPAFPATLAEVQTRIAQEWPKLQAWQAARIARTETASVWTSTAANAYRANGITEYESVVAHGPSIDVETNGACDLCVMAASGVRSLDDVDLPPWHPNAVLAGSTFAPYGRLEEFVRAKYRGPAVVLCAGEHELTIGPNHPVLSDRGMVKAKDLRPSDQLLYDARTEREVGESSVHPNVQEMPLVENAFAAARVGSTSRVTSHDLHGDVQFIQGEVEAVNPTRYLLPVLDPGGIEKLGKSGFTRADPELAAVSRLSPSKTSLDRITGSPPRLIGRAGQRLALRQRASRVSTLIARDDGCGGSSTPLRVAPKLPHSLGAPRIRLLTVTHVHLSIFEGWAFDASTSTGIYNNSGFIVSNCRCEVVPRLWDDEGTPWLPPQEPWAGGDLEDLLPTPDVGE